MGNLTPLEVVISIIPHHLNLIPSPLAVNQFVCKAVSSHSGQEWQYLHLSSPPTGQHGPHSSLPSLLPSLLSKTVGQSLPSRNVPSSRTSDPCLHNWRATALYFVLRTAAGEKGHSHRWFTSNHLVAALRLPFPWTPRPRAHHHHLDRPRPPLSHHPPLDLSPAKRVSSTQPNPSATHRLLPLQPPLSVILGIFCLLRRVLTPSACLCVVLL